MKMALAWDSIKEGDILPEIKKTPGVTQLIKFAAGGGDFNPLHHDYNFFQSKAIGSIIVHGKFKWSSLGELVSNWLCHQGRIKKISCQYRGMDFPDREMTVKGVVEKKWQDGKEKLVEVTLWTEDAKGEKTTPGKAVVVFK
jgi:acyl dehydratase